MAAPINVDTVGERQRSIATTVSPDERQATYTLAEVEGGAPITLQHLGVPNDPVTDGPPTGLTVVAGDGQAEASWNASIGVDGYRLYVDDELVYDGDETEYLIADLENDVEYEVAVSAYDRVGESAKSAVVKVTPAKPGE